VLGEIDQCAVEKLSCGTDTFDAAAPGGVSLRQGKPSENVANGRQADPAPVAEMGLSEVRRDKPACCWE
jgi:hypothetical protein